MTATPAPPPYPPPPYLPPAAPRRTNGLAIAALACAVGSFVFCPFVLAIVALGLAHGAAVHVAESGGQLEGAGMITAARIVAWIHIGLVLAVVVVASIVLLALSL